MTLKELALKLRPLIELAANSLDDSDAVEAASLFASWDEADHYVVGDRRKYNGVLYKCLKEHDAQKDWTPENAPSLWAKVLIPTDEEGQQIEIPEWEQPDSTNPYMTGDMVRFNDKIYRSLIDNNTWSPEAYPAGWEEVEE